MTARSELGKGGIKFKQPSSSFFQNRCSSSKTFRLTCGNMEKQKKKEEEKKKNKKKKKDCIAEDYFTLTSSVTFNAEINIFLLH